MIHSLNICVSNFFPRMQRANPENSSIGGQRFSVCALPPDCLAPKSAAIVIVTRGAGLTDRRNGLSARFGVSRVQRIENFPDRLL